MAAKNYTMEEKVYLVTHVDDTLGFYNRFGYSLTVPNYRRARKKIVDTMNSAMLLKELCKNAENKYQEKVQETIGLTEELNACKKEITEIKSQGEKVQKRAYMLEKENEKLKKDVKGLQELLEKKTDIFTKNKEGFTNRELVYRRIAQKYKEKCETCPLRTKPKKIDGVWMD